MSGKFTKVTQDINTQLAKIRKEMPEVMAGFSALAQAATKSQALDKKTKELIAMALAVANHCPGCIGFHSQALVKTQHHTSRIARNSKYGDLHGRRTFTDVCCRSVRSI